MRIYLAVIIGVLAPMALFAQAIQPAPIQNSPQPEIVAPPAVYTATLPVDIPFDFSELENKACDYYAGNYKDKDVDCDYKIWRNKKFEELRLHDDNVFSISAKLYYYLIFHQPLNCQCGWNDKGPALDLTIGSDTQLTFDDNLNLTAKSVFRPIQHGEHCVVCFFNRDLTDIADKMINEKVGVYLKMFDDMLSSQNAAISSKNNQFSAFMNQDIAIDGNTTFKLNARQLKATKITLYNGGQNIQHLKSAFTLDCSPQIITALTGNKNSSANSSIDLNEGNTNRFAVSYIETIPYQEIATSLMNKVKVYVNGRRKVIIQSCEVIPDSGTLGLKLKVLLRPNKKDNRFFSKVIYFFDKIFYKKWGFIYLNSSPSYDVSTNNLKLNDVRYTSDTERILLRKAKWLAGSAFCDKIGSYYEYSDSQRLNQLMQAVTNKLTTANSYFTSAFLNPASQLMETRNAPTQFQMLFKISGDLQIR